MVPRTAATLHREDQSLGSHVNQLWLTAKGKYRILTTVGAGQLFAQMVRTGRGVLIPLYGSDVLGLDVAQIGWISTFASAIDMLLFYPVGMIMDRWGRKYAIVPSFLVQGIGLALIPLTGGFFSLAAVAGLIGFGNGLGSGTMMTLGADLAPEDARGEFLGMWRLIGDMGFTLGPSVAGAVAGMLALPAAALVMGGSGVVASMIFLFLVPETVKK
jgi:MFS family permease